MEQSDADRAAVAREVLTEIANAHRELGFTAIVDVMESWRDEHYPAPAPPETVTVTVGGRVWAREVDGWWVHHSDTSHDVCGPKSTIGEMCARIASDARVIQERDARIAELEKELHETCERQLPLVRLRDEAYRQRDEHYPAPPAPETVTVTFRDGSKETLYLQDGQWQSGTGLLYDELMVRACLDRIASDARALKERDARIAELENELRRALDGTVFHEKQAHEARAERDAALRALEEAKVAIGAALAELTSRKNDKHRAQYAYDALAPFEGKGLGKINGAEQAPAEEPADRRVTVDAAPAPIPLGAVVEVEGVEWTRTESGWNGGAWRYHDSSTVARVLTALYRARHPVATRETVERVRKALLQAFRATRVGEDFTENCTRAALTAAGFTLEEGA